MTFKPMRLDRYVWPTPMALVMIGMAGLGRAVQARIEDPLDEERVHDPERRRHDDRDGHHANAPPVGAERRDDTPHRCSRDRALVLLGERRREESTVTTHAVKDTGER